MGFPLKTFAQFKSDLQATIVRLTSLIDDFSSGSVANATTETVATQHGFVQRQSVALLATTRLRTSSLPDAITFVEDYNLQPPYLGPTYGTGVTTFGRNQPSSSPQILFDGTIAQNKTPSPTSALQYIVTANTADPNWSANVGGTGMPGRTLAANALSLDATVQALTIGTAGRIIAGGISVIATAGVPFDTVTNADAITNGSDGETVAQLAQRFSDAFSTKSGTRFAIAAAVAGVQAGLSFTINDLTLPSGAPLDGNATIVVDDGSGAIPQSVIDAVENAVVAVTQKSLGAHIYVVAPSNVNVSVQITGTTIAPGFAAGDVRAALANAIVNFVNGNGVGGAPAGTGSNFPSLKLSYVALANLVATFIGNAAGQGLSSYGSVLLDGAQADVALTTFQLARTTLAEVSVT